MDIWGWLILRCQIVLHIVECLAASMVSTYEIPAAPPTQVVITKHVSTHHQASLGEVGEIFPV